MTVNKFETSMDRIVKSVEGDSPTTNIYADPIERIADALENGSGGGGSGSGIVRLTFHEEDGNVILDKPWSEIFALAQENLVFIVQSPTSIQLELVSVVSMNVPSTYFVETVYFDSNTLTVLHYSCDSENGYPFRES